MSAIVKNSSWRGVALPDYAKLNDPAQRRRQKVPRLQLCWPCAARWSVLPKSADWVKSSSTRVPPNASIGGRRCFVEQKKESRIAEALHCRRAQFETLATHGGMENVFKRIRYGCHLLPQRWQYELVGRAYAT